MSTLDEQRFFTVIGNQIKISEQSSFGLVKGAGITLYEAKADTILFEGALKVNDSSIGNVIQEGIEQDEFTYTPTESPEYILDVSVTQGSNIYGSLSYDLNFADLSDLKLINENLLLFTKVVKSNFNNMSLTLESRLFDLIKTQVNEGGVSLPSNSALIKNSMLDNYNIKGYGVKVEDTNTVPAETPIGFDIEGIGLILENVLLKNSAINAHLSELSNLTLSTVGTLSPSNEATTIEGAGIVMAGEGQNKVFQGYIYALDSGINLRSSHTRASIQAIGSKITMPKKNNEEFEPVINVTASEISFEVENLATSDSLKLTCVRPEYRNMSDYLFGLEPYRAEDKESYAGCRIEELLHSGGNNTINGIISSDSLKIKGGTQLTATPDTSNDESLTINELSLNGPCSIKLGNGSANSATFECSEESKEIKITKIDEASITVKSEKGGDVTIDEVSGELSIEINNGGDISIDKSSEEVSIRSIASSINIGEISSFNVTATNGSTISSLSTSYDESITLNNTSYSGYLVGGSWGGKVCNYSSEEQGAVCEDKD
jgi:hypothetical protein